MLFLPVDGAETPVTIESRAQLEALIGSDKLVQIGVTGGKVLVFSEESPVMRDGEPFYPQRNNRASGLRKSRVAGNAVIGSLHELEFDKYEGVETMACRRCRETVEYSPDTAYCEGCLAEKKRGASTFLALVAVFVAGWAVGGVSPLARMIVANAQASPVAPMAGAAYSASAAPPVFAAPSSGLPVAPPVPEGNAAGAPRNTAVASVPGMIVSRVGMPSATPDALSGKSAASSGNASVSFGNAPRSGDMAVSYGNTARISENPPGVRPFVSSLAGARSETPPRISENPPASYRNTQGQAVPMR